MDAYNKNKVGCSENEGLENDDLQNENPENEDLENEDRRLKIRKMNTKTKTKNKDPVLNYWQSKEFTCFSSCPLAIK